MLPNNGVDNTPLDVELPVLVISLPHCARKNKQFPPSPPSPPPAHTAIDADRAKNVPQTLTKSITVQSADEVYQTATSQLDQPGKEFTLDKEVIFGIMEFYGSVCRNSYSSVSLKYLIISRSLASLDRVAHMTPCEGNNFGQKRPVVCTDLWAVAKPVTRMKLCSSIRAIYSFYMQHES